MTRLHALNLKNAGFSAGRKMKTISSLSWKHHHGCIGQVPSISLVWLGPECRQEVSGRQDTHMFSPEEIQRLNYTVILS